MAMHDIPDTIFAMYSVAVVALLGFAAWRDIATRTIPDTVSIILIVIGCGTRLAQGWQPFAVSLIVAFAVFILLLPLCSRGLLGGADLKLLSALATGLSPQASLHVLADVTIVGGTLALLYLALGRVLVALGTRTQPRGRTSSVVQRIVNVEFWRIRRRSPLPYGIAIAVGAVFAVLNHQGV